MTSARAALALLAMAVTVSVAAAAPPAAVPDAWAPSSRPPQILPRPQSLLWLPPAFPLSDRTRIVVGDEAAAEDLYAARDLNAELRTLTGRALPVVRAAEVGEARDIIVLGEPALNRWSAALVAREGLRVLPEDPGPEGYVLKVAPDVVVAAGSDRRGTYYAVQTLRQLLVAAGNGLGFAGAEVRDWPAHRFRAVHLLLDDASDDFHVALIARILSKFKFNTIVAQADYVRWESARNLWHRSGASKDEVVVLLRAAREHHLEVIPLIQTLGHVEWLYTNDQNLDLLEIPPDQSNARYVYNPLNPRVYQVLFPILDEAVRLFQPRYLHIGHDEVRNVVPFPWSEEGKRLGFGELFVRDVLQLYRFLQARGVGTMMWGDVLLTHDFAPLVQRLPRDIIMVDWQYQEATRYPSLGRFIQWGFPTIAATWWKPQNIVAFAREGEQQGAAGMLRTTWTGHFQNRSVLERQYQQIYTYLVAADAFWNPGAAAEAFLKPSPVGSGGGSAEDPAARFRREWQPTPLRTQPISGAVLDLRAAATRSHVDQDGRGWIGKGPEFDLRALSPGRRRLGNILFEIVDPAQNGGRSVVLLRGAREELRRLPLRARIPVGRRAAAVAFLHTTPFAGPRFGQEVGAYVVRYTDGTQETVPLLYKRNIGSWLDEPVSMEQQVAWSGRTRSGLEVRLSLLVWANPHPAKAIAAIEVITGGSDATVALFAVTLLDALP
ncbi:MAG: beta-N-acetylhexosaminidase [Armatimonadota bacterium]|nr:beta-N-acetylhexosaminidase [Armatimonadota bacterium]